MPVTPSRNRETQGDEGCLSEELQGRSAEYRHRQER